MFLFVLPIKLYYILFHAILTRTKTAKRTKIAARFDNHAFNLKIYCIFLMNIFLLKCNMLMGQQLQGKCNGTHTLNISCTKSVISCMASRQYFFTIL